MPINPTDSDSDLLSKFKIGLIDVHHHFGTPLFAKFMADHNDDNDRKFPPVTWSVEEDIADMDASGVQTAILSQFPPYNVGTPEEHRLLARDLNNSAAKHAANYPGRFGLFTCLPIRSIEDSLAEIIYGFDELGADGVAMMTSVDEKWLGDTFFYPLYEELNRRKAVVYVHPYTPSCCCGLVPEIPEYIIEYGTDTTRTIGSLIWSGTTERFPDIRFIFSHGGGTMPFLIERFLAGTKAEVVPGIATKGKSPPFVPPQPARGILGELRSLYYDTAQCSNPIALRALKDVVTPGQILYGSDYWYRTNVETVEGLDTCQVFSEKELEGVKFKNSQSLFEGQPGRKLRDRRGT